MVIERARQSHVNRAEGHQRRYRREHELARLRAVLLRGLARWVGHKTGLSCAWALTAVVLMIKSRHR